DVEGPVAQALAVQDQEPLEDAKEAAVGDPRGVEALAGLPAAGAGAPLEEGIGVGIEEPAGAGGQVERALGAAGVDQAKERTEPGPGAEALVHGVGVAAGVLAEALVEAGDRVALGVDRALGHEPLILGVEQEDQTQQHGEEAAVDVLGVLAGERAQERPAGLGVGGPKAAEELQE